MPTSTKRAIILIGGVVAALLVLALAVPAVGRIVQTTETVQHELPADLTALSLDGSVGDVTVRAADDGEATSARATIRSGLSTPTTDAIVEGGQARVSDTCSGAWWSNCSVTWTLVVPADTALEIVRDVGDISVREVTGPLSIDSSVGSISATGIGSPTVEARSSVGDVTLELATPPDRVTVAISTGDVSVMVPDDDTSYRVTAETSVGKTRNEVGSDPGASRVVEVRSSVGDVTLRRAG